MPALKSFELWLAEEREGERRMDEEVKRHGTCQGCGAEDVDLLVNETCARCAGYGWGFDQAQEVTLCATIGGAVEGALRQEVPEAMVRAAVEEAFQRSHDRQLNSWLRVAAAR